MHLVICNKQRSVTLRLETREGRGKHNLLLWIIFCFVQFIFSFLTLPCFWFTYRRVIIYQLTALIPSIMFLEKLIVSHLVTKFLAVMELIIVHCHVHDIVTLVPIEPDGSSRYPPVNCTLFHFHVLSSMPRSYKWCFPFRFSFLISPDTKYNLPYYIKEDKIWEVCDTHERHLKSWR